MVGMIDLSNRPCHARRQSACGSSARMIGGHRRREAETCVSTTNNLGNVSQAVWASGIALAAHRTESARPRFG